MRRRVMQRSNSAFTLTAVIGTMVATVGLVIGSPKIMMWALGDPASWNDVADLGQAYSGAAALLSAFALIGVAVSLFLQWRSMQVQIRAQANQRHFELMKLSMEIPELWTAGMGTDDPQTAIRWRRANLWMSYWAEMWDVNQLDERGLRNVVTAYLASDATAYTWWQGHQKRGGWAQLKGRRRAQFEQIVTEEFERGRAAHHLVEPAPSASGMGSATAS